MLVPAPIIGHKKPDQSEAELFAIVKTKGINDRKFFLGLCAGFTNPSEYTTHDTDTIEGLLPRIKRDFGIKLNAPPKI
jgi:hypothetical protein